MTTECDHRVNSRTGVCFLCHQQVQDEAPAPLPAELVELLGDIGALLTSKNGDELNHAAIIAGVALQYLAAGAVVDAKYPDLAPTWPREVERAAGEIRRELGGTGAGE